MEALEDHYIAAARLAWRAGTGRFERFDSMYFIDRSIEESRSAVSSCHL